MIKLTQNYILIEPVEQSETTPGGIVLPLSVEKTTQKGKVVAFGPGVYQNGTLISVNLSLGDVVLYKNYAHKDEVEVNGSKYFLLRETEVFGVE